MVVVLPSQQRHQTVGTVEGWHVPSLPQRKRITPAELAGVAGRYGIGADRGEVVVAFANLRRCLN
jgi:hypothetical protein